MPRSGSGGNLGARLKTRPSCFPAYSPADRAIVAPLLRFRVYASISNRWNRRGSCSKYETCRKAEQECINNLKWIEESAREPGHSTSMQIWILWRVFSPSFFYQYIPIICIGIILDCALLQIYWTNLWWFRYTQFICILCIIKIEVVRYGKCVGCLRTINLTLHRTFSFCFFFRERSKRMETCTQLL